MSLDRADWSVWISLLTDGCWDAPARPQRTPVPITPALGWLAAMLCAFVIVLSAQVSAAPPAETGTRDSSAVTIPSLPVAVLPRDPHILYVGRFDTREPAGPRCAWSASRIELRFSGASLNVMLNDTGEDAYEVTVNGAAGPVLTTHRGTAIYSLLKGTRPIRAGQADTVILVKRTEPFVGTTQFLGFQLSAGGRILSLPARSPRRIEVIGDSISCGYGDEASDQNQHFSPATEDASLSYGAVAARALDAEYDCVAWSGRTLWPTDTIPEIYGLTLPDDPTSQWDFTRWIPDAVVINLGTNDFRDDNPDRASWTSAYEGFVARVRKNYPRAVIYCASGPMLSDTWPPKHQALTTLNSYLSQVVDAAHTGGDPNVHLLLFLPQSAENGYGADWHPSLKTQAIMAATLTGAIRRDLGWGRQNTSALSEGTVHQPVPAGVRLAHRDSQQ